RQTAGRIQAVLDGCRFAFGGDITATAVLEFLATLRNDRPAPQLPAEQEWFTPAELAGLLGVTRRAVTAMIRRQGLRDTAKGRGGARLFPRDTATALLELSGRGLGSQTVAYYWCEFKTFCGWLSNPRQKRLLENPLAGVEGPDPRQEPRHDRRPLSEDE